MRDRRLLTGSSEGAGGSLALLGASHEHGGLCGCFYGRGPFGGCPYNGYKLPLWVYIVRRLIFGSSLVVDVPRVGR